MLTNREAIRPGLKADKNRHQRDGAKDYSSLEYADFKKTSSIHSHPDRNNCLQPTQFVQFFAIRYLKCGICYLPRPAGTTKNRVRIQSKEPVYVSEIGMLIEMMWRKPESDEKTVSKWLSERL